jgi:hypothetical protein
MVKFHSTRYSKKSLESYGSTKAAGANVRSTRLPGGGKQANAAKMGKRKSGKY